MSVIYTKSALKKIKKDDLIDIYLSQQQKMSQLRVNTEKLQEGLDKWVESHAKWIKEAERLKNENEELRLQAFGTNGNTTGEGIILKPPIRKDYQEKINFLKDELHQKGIDEQSAIEACENAEEQVEELTEQVEELTEQVEELKDFTHWENHPALKHKVVLDSDFYMEHLNDDDELIDPDEHNDIANKLNCITKYVAGDFSMQDEVEEHLKETYSTEFIKGNTEHWKEFGLFEEEV